MKPGFEEEVTALFQGSGRPDHEVRDEQGNVVGRLLTTMVFVGKEAAVRVIEVEGDVRVVAGHISRQDEVKAFEQGVEQYLVRAARPLEPRGRARVLPALGHAERPHPPPRRLRPSQLRVAVPGVELARGRVLRRAPGLRVVRRDVGVELAADLLEELVLPHRVDGHLEVLLRLDVVHVDVVEHEEAPVRHAREPGSSVSSDRAKISATSSSEPGLIFATISPRFTPTPGHARDRTRSAAGACPGRLTQATRR